MTEYVEGKGILVSGGPGAAPVITIPVTDFIRDLLDSGDQGSMAIGHLVREAYLTVMEYAAVRAADVA